MPLRTELDPAYEKMLAQRHKSNPLGYQSIDVNTLPRKPKPIPTSVSNALNPDLPAAMAATNASLSPIERLQQVLRVGNHPLANMDWMKQVNAQPTAQMQPLGPLVQLPNPSLDAGKRRVASGLMTESGAPVEAPSLDLVSVLRSLIRTPYQL